MYHCLNLISEEKDVAGGVLIRGIEPLEGIEEMSKLDIGKIMKSYQATKRKIFLMVHQNYAWL